jgi:hypothetical protein
LLVVVATRAVRFSQNVEQDGSLPQGVCENDEKHESGCAERQKIPQLLAHLKGHTVQ